MLLFRVCVCIPEVLHKIRDLVHEAGENSKVKWRMLEGINVCLRAWLKLHVLGSFL